MSELIHSDIANAYKINNMPTTQHMDNMLRLIHYTLQPIRLLYPKPETPMIITGCYRSQALFQKLKDLGRNPAKNSQHLTGQAADFYIVGVDINEVFDSIVSSDITFDQLILEYDSKGNIWIHVSHVDTAKNRRQVIRNLKQC